MASLSVFNSESLDGYFTDAANDMSWAHKQDPEWAAFTTENAKGEARLVFGRVTYEMMVSFWPTPAAMEQMPEVAKKMNSLPKVVFSRSLDKATWSNTKLVKDDIVEAMRGMKADGGPDMVIMGSGKIVSQMAQAGLIDLYQIVTCPIVLGSGRTMFEGMKEKLPLKRTKTREFQNGNVVSWYEPAR